MMMNFAGPLYEKPGGKVKSSLWNGTPKFLYLHESALGLTESYALLLLCICLCMLHINIIYYELNKAMLVEIWIPAIFTKHIDDRIWAIAIVGTRKQVWAIIETKRVTMQIVHLDLICINKYYHTLCKQTM